MAFGADSPTRDVGTVEVIDVDSRVVACDGDGGPLGHPRVWLRIVHDQTYCPYCSRVYRLIPGTGDEIPH